MNEFSEKYFINLRNKCGGEIKDILSKNFVNYSNYEDIIRQMC